MQPISVSREKVRVMTPTGPVFFLQIAPKWLFVDTKIGCIRLVWAGGANNYKFSFLLCAGPLSSSKKRACFMKGRSDGQRFKKLLIF